MRPTTTPAMLASYFSDLPPERIDQGCGEWDPVKPCCVGAHLAHLLLDVDENDDLHFYRGVDAWAAGMGGNRAHAIVLLRQAGAGLDPLGSEAWATPAATVFARLSAVETLPDLRWANLYEAKLREADLRGAHLLGAHLREAHLREADLRGAHLRWANLRWAKLYEADLEGADLRGADLRGADLRGADLRGADLRGADLRGANLRGANLYEADLEGADLRGAKLRGAITERSAPAVEVPAGGEAAPQEGGDVIERDPLREASSAPPAPPAAHGSPSTS